MKYTNKSFTVGTTGSDAYREGWERTFKPKPEEPCHLCGGEIGQDRWERGLMCYGCGPVVAMPDEKRAGRSPNRNYDPFP